MAGLSSSIIRKVGEAQKADRIDDFDEKSGYAKSTGMYFSTRPAFRIPEEPFLSFTQYMFAHSYGSKIALVDAPTGKTVSFEELEQQVMALAAGLGSIGVCQGNTVILIAPNSILYPVVFLSVMAIGAVITTANYVNTFPELERQIQDSEARLVVTISSLVQKVKKSGLPLVLMDEDGVSDHVSQPDDAPIFFLSNLLRSDSSKAPPVRIHQEDTAALLYSSGTTGMSKGVIISHKNLISSTIIVFSPLPPAPVDEVILCVLPMFHIYGFSCIVCANLCKARTVVVMPQYNFESMLAAVGRYRVTVLPVVPPVILHLVKRQPGRQYDLSSLRDVGSAAAPLGKELMEAFMKMYPGVQLSQAYGLTETSGLATLIFRQEVMCIGSSGKLVSNVKSKVVDFDSGRFLPPYEKGEIWLHGPCITTGYFKKNEATMATIDSEGWLHTGDIGFFNNEGQLFVVDRLKEMIKYKSFQVAPAELEAVLASHPEITDAAVIPCPDEEAGEVPMAFVVRSPGSTLNEEKVKSFVAAQVSPYKKVRQVVFTNAIPKSASGKILRKELIQLLRSKI
ncbi:hypothetical protein O6H91_06G111100 [Diphasiastrum complanatum]|uniref:Uncharacterized protein n=1 Tax=Diphasiastrum complanatum TaxID=34168 RepID=A0ACC2DHU1_DIPCM|nr:hypothetical protein O6H91_06G111100 [Diphasiastrum complanatum]